MVQILGLSGNSPDLPHASMAGFSTPSGRLLLSNGRSLQANSAPIRVRGRSIARSYRKLAMWGPTRQGSPIRWEQQARLAPMPNGGARVQAHAPEELWPIGMRMMPDLSMIRGNQAGSDGPRLLSELNSKNEVKMPFKRRKRGTFYRKSYVVGYGRTHLLPSCYAYFLQNGLRQPKHHNSISHNLLSQKPDF